VIEVAFVDNVVLSSFARVGRLDLLERLQPPVAHTTEAVLAEHAAGIASGSVPSGTWPRLPVVPLGEGEWRVATTLPGPLGPGERTCLALAVQRGGALATDDLPARHAAQRLGVPLTGTVGILVASVRQGLITLGQGNTLPSAMIAGGYHAPARALDALLNP
jgi:predicted nucleic acid-binding protein